MQKTTSALVLSSVLLISVHPTNGVALEADPTANVSASEVRYKSPFKDYRPLGEDKRILWKAANDEVGRIGGWRVYARESATESPEKESNTAPLPTQSSAEPSSAVGEAPGSASKVPADAKNASAPARKPEPKPKSNDKPAPSEHAAPDQPK